MEVAGCGHPAPGAAGGEGGVGEVGVGVGVEVGVETKQNQNMYIINGRPLYTIPGISWPCSGNLYA